MNNLLLFFIRLRPWLLFCVYVVVSCIFLFQSNPYQHSVYLTSANAVTSGIYELSNNVTSYFNLRDINEDLQSRNVQLEKDLLALKARVQYYEELDYARNLPSDSVLQRYDFIIAHVINNSVHRSHNYVPIN